MSITREEATSLMNQEATEQPAGQAAGVAERAGGFWALVGTMFQGAFSDNVYKLVLTLLVLDFAKSMSLSPDETTAMGAKFQMYIGLAFALPWILAATFAGWLSDARSKSAVTQWTKIMEIVVMVVATAGFALHGFSLAWAVYAGIAVMFLMSLQSALFSPSKYGILPELLPMARLGWANGVLQGFTFISIVLGTLAAPALYAWSMDSGQLWIVGVLLVMLAAVGLVISYQIPRIPPANPSEKLRVNPFEALAEYGGVIMRTPGLPWAVAGTFLWWLVAVMLQSAAPMICKSVLGISDAWLSIALLPIAIGMGAGSFVAGMMSKHRVELGLIPFGAAGMLVIGAVVGMYTPLPAVADGMNEAELFVPRLVIPALMGVAGFFAGMVIVPLQAYILQASDDRYRAGVWATTSLLTAIAWMVGAVLYEQVVGLRSHPADVFTVSGVLLAVMVAVITWRFPRIPLHFLVLVFFRTFYRVRAAGLPNVPRTGGALLTPNHQAYIDALLLVAVLDRPVRFVMSAKVFNYWWVKPIARLTNSIPVETDLSPRELITSLRIAREEIEAGGLVCLFPEGQLTRNGQMQPFRRGLTRVMDGLNAPIIPIAIDGAYDSAFAMKDGRFAFRERFRIFPPKPLSIVVGEALPSSTDLFVLRQRVAELLGEAFEMRRADHEPLHRAAIHTLRARVLKSDFSDHASEGLAPNKRVLAGVALLGRRLRPHWQDQEFVGVLLPPCIGSLIINVASLTAGHVPVNLNYTASQTINTDICRRTGIRTVITSRAFLEKASLELPEGVTPVWLEDLREGVGKTEQLVAFLAARFLPLGWLERWLGRTHPAKLDDVATLIFSSGSTGVPKGVRLSHWNITANVMATLQVVALPNAQPRFLGILPFFHSFGYMATLWLPLLRGVGVSYYPNPLDGRAVGAVVQQFQVTHMFATPTFLAGYLRRVEPGQLGSLTFLVTGAEKLRERLALAFEERFGIRPREGFGCTECAPVVAINGTDVRAPGMYQAGGRIGTVGRPLPGVCVRIVHLETGKLCGAGESGMLLVKGPNVMLGYHGMEEKTREVLSADGWYQTGDVARLDEDGYLEITDRLARFSKIGGEMVPHLRIEEALQGFVATEVPVFAVTAVPDEARGERLVVLYSLPEAEAQEAARRLKDESGLPALWLPKWNDFVKVEAIPALGSGKMDLQAMRRIAAERTA